MNVKEYIASGMIESYVMGLLTEAERREFESVCAQYPEIAAARTAFETALEEQLLADAKPAPQQMRQQIFDKISATGSDAITEEVEEERTPVRSMGIWKFLAAASVILMAGAIYWAFSVNAKYKNEVAKNEELQKQVQDVSAQMADAKQERELLQKPGVKMAALRGTAHSPHSYVTVYWDTLSQSKDVYLMVNNLPEPASDKQYQLWALMNGQPTDLGVFDMDIRQNKLLVKMQNVQNAQAFAITLEPKGGSASPTLDAMYVVGNL